MRLKLVERKRKLNEEGELQLVKIKISPLDYIKLTTNGVTYDLIQDYIDNKKIPQGENLTDDEQTARDIIIRGINIEKDFAEEKYDTISLGISKEGKVLNHSGRGRAFARFIRKPNKYIDVNMSIEGTSKEIPPKLISQFDKTQQVYRANIIMPKEEQQFGPTFTNVGLFLNKLGRSYMGVPDNKKVEQFKNQFDIFVDGKEVYLEYKDRMSTIPNQMEGINMLGLYTEPSPPPEKLTTYRFEFIKEFDKKRIPDEAGPVEIKSK